MGLKGVHSQGLKKVGHVQGTEKKTESKDYISAVCEYQEPSVPGGRG